MMKKTPYSISNEQIEYIQDHTFNMVYDKTMYWLYSERMPILQPFLQRKKDDHVSLEDLLEYCKNQQIQIYPMSFRNRKVFTNIASYKVLFNMKRRGLLIKSNIVAKLIIEYSKYCVDHYPVQPE